MIDSHIEQLRYYVTEELLPASSDAAGGSHGSLTQLERVDTLTCMKAATKPSTFDLEQLYVDSARAR